MTVTLNEAAADPQQIIADLQRDRDEALAREAALAEVLRVVNSVRMMTFYCAASGASVTAVTYGKNFLITRCVRKTATRSGAIAARTRASV